MTAATKSRKSKSKARAPRQDIAQIVTDRIIEKLQQGTVVWQKTWAGGSSVPRSLSTGKPYRGINLFLLAFSGFASEWWGTYNQIVERGGQVRKGEQHTKVVFWKLLKKETTDADGNAKTTSIPFLQQYQVFNADQCDWEDAKRPPKVEPTRNPGERVQACEALVTEYLATGPKLAHGGDRAFYRPGTDSVTMPRFEVFDSPEAYHSTLFHELTHSTGHSSRLARQGIADGTFGGFGDKVYSNEELVAELGAAILCGLAGIAQDAVLDNSASYIAHWLKVLQEDNRLIITAAAQAQKAVDLILGTKFEDDES